VVANDHGTGTLGTAEFQVWILARARLALLCLSVAAGAALAADVPRSGPPPDTMAERVAACVSCHGSEGRATSGGYFPRIAGKPQGYLFNQLLNFRDGRRRNPAMNYLVANLPDAYLAEIAAYFAAQNPPYPAPQPVTATAAALERGRLLVSGGDAAKNLPACAACHGSALTGVLPSTPGLLGLPRDYLISQVGAWKNGVRHAAAPDCMAEIAARLGQDDLGAIVGYLAAQPVPEQAAPAAAAAGPPPLQCGSLAAREGP
jgi:cytochrome c553